MKKSTGLVLSAVLFFAVLLQAGGSSLLWEISGNGLASPSYLFGTIHIRDSWVFKLDRTLFDRMSACRTFASEIRFDDSFREKAVELMSLPGGRTLRDRFSPRDYRLIAVKLRQMTGFDIALFDRLKPVTLMALAVQQNMTNDTDLTLDEFLSKKAGEKGLELLGLETVEEQSETLTSLPDASVLRFFRQYDRATVRKYIAVMVETYCAGDVDALYSLGVESEEMDPDFTARVLTDRNVRLTGRMIAVMTDRPVFTAVGAAHLGGPGGMIDLLRNRGFTVLPVVAAVSQALGPSAGAEWTLHEFENRTISCLLPAEPEKVSTTVDSPGGPLQAVSYVLQPPAGGKVLAYGISCVEYPVADGSAFRGDKLDGLYDQATRNAALKVKGRIVSSRQVGDAGLAGRDCLIIYGGKSAIRLKIFFTGNRMVIFQVICAPGVRAGGDIDRFMDSVHVRRDRAEK